MTRAGTCVALENQGVLLQGPSGSGKSDLALRLIDGGAALVADDRVALRAEAGGLTASPPEALQGLLEVRGLGIFRLPYRSGVPLSLVVDLAGDHDERLPAPASMTLLGHPLPVVRLSPTAASAAARIRLALGTAEPVAGALGPAA